MLRLNVAQAENRIENHVHEKPAARGARLYRSSVAKGLEVFDFLLITFVVAIVVRLYTRDQLLSASLAVAMPMTFATLAFWWVLRENDLYVFKKNLNPVRHFFRVIGALLLALPLSALIGLMMHAITGRPWEECVGEAIFITCLHGIIIGFVHLIAATIVSHLTETGFFSVNVVIVGATERARRLITHKDSSGDLCFMGIFDDRQARVPKKLAEVPVLGTLDDLMNWEKLPSVDRVVITVPSTAQSRVRQLSEKLSSIPNKIVLAIDMQGFESDATTIGRLGSFPVAYVSGTPEDAKRAFWKRVQDLIIAPIALILLSPIMILTAIAIKLESKGPVFFRQRRHGFNNQSFYCWKFRSMRTDMTDYKAEKQVVKDDPRVTRVGKFIRKTSIDELPQLFNVILGDMSLVGPRPHAIGMKTGNIESEKLVYEYAHRHRIKPGITGWAAIHGSRGPVNTKEDVETRVHLDTEYIDNSSLWLDIYIIFMTIPSFLGDKAAVR